MTQPHHVTRYADLIATLVAGSVEFILIGGAAAIAHGAARLTLDVDVAYRRSRENCERLAAALAPYEPYMRGAPPGLPFIWDAQTIRRGLNFTLQRTLGDIDLLGEVTGGGTYEDLAAHATPAEAFGVTCLCLDLPTLIRVKRAAGRPKDLEAIAELEVMLEERGDSGE